MAKKKMNPEQDLLTLPNVTAFSLIQLDRDLNPAPPARRILQVVIQDGVVTPYVSAQAYADLEVHAILESLMGESFRVSIPHQKPALTPTKGKIHWVTFTPDFAETGKGQRTNPETGETY